MEKCRTVFCTKLFRVEQLYQSSLIAHDVFMQKLGVCQEAKSNIRYITRFVNNISTFSLGFYFTVPLLIVYF